MRRSALLLAVALLLPACGGDDDGTDATDTTSVATTEALDATGGDTATTSTTAAGGSGTTATTEAAATLVLEPDGLRVDAGGGGELVAFDTAQDEVIDAVAPALGEPTEERASPECPPGPADEAVFADGITLTFQDGAFVGWMAQPGADATTEGGIGVGSTLGEVRSTLEVLNVEETSLGMEFAAEGFYGLLTDDTEEGEVTALFAGANCIFR